MEEYDKSESFIKYGNWYREEKDDVFDGQSWRAVSSGFLKGQSKYLSRAPKIEFSSESLYFKVENFFKYEKLPEPKDDSTFGFEISHFETIILNSRNQEIDRTTVRIKSFDNEWIYSSNFLEKHKKNLIKGAKLLIRFNNYTPSPLKKIEEYIEENKLIKLSSVEDYYFLSSSSNFILNFYRTTAHKYGIGVRIKSSLDSKKSYLYWFPNYYKSNNYFYVTETLLEKIKRHCIKYNDFLESPDSDSLYYDRSRWSYSEWKNKMERERENFKRERKVIVNQLVECNSKIFLMNSSTKNEVDFQNTYFEYSLSGSSQALAD
jgi:hypothetical protein